MIDRFKYFPVYELVLPVFHYFDLLRWHLRGKTPPTPHLLKQRLLVNYSHKYGLRILVETGTYLGAMVEAVKRYFDKIYTIELDKTLYMRAKKKFEGEKHIKVIRGDSSKVLTKILPIIKDPCLFWLDAHYSGGITSKGEKFTPILAELAAIWARGQEDVVLVDDAHLFNGKNDYPTYAQLKRMVKAKAGKTIKRECGVLVIS